MNAAKTKEPKECTKFEPQAWRKNRCKNCFKTEYEHTKAENQAKDGEEDSKTKTGVKVKKRPPVPFAKGDKSKESQVDGKGKEAGSKSDVSRKIGSASPKASPKVTPKSPKVTPKSPKTPDRIKKLDNGKLGVKGSGGDEKDKSPVVKRKIGGRVGALIASKEEKGTSKTPKDASKNGKDGNKSGKGNDIMSPSGKKKQVGVKKTDKPTEKTPVKNVKDRSETKVSDEESVRRDVKAESGEESGEPGQTEPPGSLQDQAADTGQQKHHTPTATHQEEMADKNKQQQDKNTTAISMPEPGEKADMCGSVKAKDEPKIPEPQQGRCIEQKPHLEEGKHSSERYEEEDNSRGKRDQQAEGQHNIELSPDTNSQQLSEDEAQGVCTFSLPVESGGKEEEAAVDADRHSGTQAEQSSVLSLASSDIHQSVNYPSCEQQAEQLIETGLHVPDQSSPDYSSSSTQLQVAAVEGPLDGADQAASNTHHPATQHHADKQNDLETTTDFSWRSASSPNGEDSNGSDNFIDSQNSESNGVTNHGDRGVYVNKGRQRPPERECSTEQQRAQLKARWRAMEDFEVNVSREEAMIEGSRYLIENLKEKVSLLEDKCDRLDREKAALGDLLAVRKAEFNDQSLSLRNKVDDLEDSIKRYEAENQRLSERLKLPESERTNIRDQEKEIVTLKKKVDEYENKLLEREDLTHNLQQEINDLHLEMEEMHDQFRDEETLEFREIQKELEATAKNCRILQFKLRKSERRNEQVEVDRVQYEDKIRQLESRFVSDEKSHIRELEEELRMAKEVSVRLHDELEMVEEKRIKSDEEVERIQDYLRESENRRVALQTEVESLNTEVESLREALSKVDDATKATLDVPKERPMLRKTGSQGSVEYDMEQLMRDLSDNLERENDLKEQLKYAEEENKIARKKISDLEEENESINIQLQKMSAAKSGKYFHKKPEREKKSSESESSDEEPELLLQVELMENEMKVLRRKMDETEQENDNLLAEVKFLQEKLARKDLPDIPEEEDDRPFEERIEAMTKNIDDLKMKLIEKDRQAEKLRMSPSPSGDLPKKGVLKKSKSLDLDQQIDVKKSLESIQVEANVLKEKISELESDNARLASENKKLQLITSRQIPSIQTDDAAVQNIELKDKLKDLETENTILREKIKTLDARTNRLSKQVTQTKGKEEGLDDSDESRDLRDQLSLVEEECSVLRKKMAELEAQNSKLSKELAVFTGDKTEDATKSPDAKKNFDMSSASKFQLRERIKDLESEVRDLLGKVQTREEENEKIMEEMTGYRDDIDSIMATFRQREQELLADMEAMQNKNNVISSLLDLVTERAESAQKELYGSESTSTPTPQSERSSVLSGISDARGTSTGSDEVFLQIPRGEEGGKLIPKDWDEQFLRRIKSLEELLREERQKNQASEKIRDIHDDVQHALTDDAKLLQKEKDILKKELTLAQHELKEAKDSVEDLKDRLKKMETAHESIRQDYDKISKELKDTRKRLKEKQKEMSEKEEKADEEALKAAKERPRAGSRGSIGSLGARGDKEPISWRIEKQDMEKQIKDLTKRVDDLDRQLRKKSSLVRQSSLTGLPGEEAKAKEKMDEKLEKLKKEKEKLKEENKDLETRNKEIQESFEKYQSQWEAEKDILESTKKAAEKEADQKVGLIKQKDDLIAQKDELLKVKDKLLKELQDGARRKDSQTKHKEDELQEKTERLQKLEKDLSEKEAGWQEKESEWNAKEKSYIEKANTTAKEGGDREALVSEMESRLKDLDETIRLRDERLAEKDEVLEKLNRALSEKESEVNDLDQSIRQAMKKLDEKEAELNDIKSVCDEYQSQDVGYKENISDLEEKVSKLDRVKNSETANLVIEKEKLENQLEYITKEKRVADNEIRLLRTTLQEREEEWAKTSQKYETDLGKKADKIHSLEILQSTREDDVIKNLFTEKETLVKDRQRLEDIVKKLRSELEKARGGWSAEVADLNKTVAEARKKQDDKSRESYRLAKEVLHLKDQLSKAGISTPLPMSGATTPSLLLSPQSSRPMSPLSPLSPTSPVYPGVLAPDLMGALERQELLFKAEKVGIEELYEARLRIMQEQLIHTSVEISNLRKENHTQKELLIGSSKTLSEIKNKYDSGMKSWNEERILLEKRAQEGEQRKAAFTTMDQKLESAGQKLREEETKRQDLEAQLRLERKEWESTRVDLQEKMDKMQGTVKQAEEGEYECEHLRLMMEMQAVAHDFKVRMHQAEEKRNSDIQEMQQKLDTVRREVEKEKKDSLDRNYKLEEKGKQIAPLQRTLIDLQYKLHSYREAWLRERGELQKQADEARRNHLEEKQKFVELLAEVKKVKTLVPVLEDDAKSTDSDASRDGRHRSETVIELSTVGRKPSDEERHLAAKAIDEEGPSGGNRALEHISNLAEDLNRSQTKRREKKTTAHPAFRRSLSSSEAEIEMALQQQFEQHKKENERQQKQQQEQQQGQQQGQQQRQREALLEKSKKRQSAPTQLLTMSRSVDRSPSPQGSKHIQEEDIVPEEETTVAQTAPPGEGEVVLRRARPVMRRSHSSTSSDVVIPVYYPTSSLDRPSRHSLPQRSSIHASGTQSAYSSRDASPEKGMRYNVGKSPYPAPPPSFLITPPRSPRHFSPSPHGHILTSENMIKLYKKLGDIERTEEERAAKSRQLSQSDAIVQERTGAVRMLTKSMSMDAAEEDPPWLERAGDLPERMSYIELKRNSETYADAPLSQTLPASIRIGELIITPGIEKLCKNFGPEMYVAAGLISPRSSRKKFYENYPHTNPNIFAVSEAGARPKKMVSFDDSLNKPIQGPRTIATISVQGDKVKARTYDQDQTKEKHSIGERASAFFSSVKDKRKLFGMKKSSSIDSAVGSSVAKAGVQAATPAAPSTYEPPPIKVPDQSSKRKSFHKRAASLDLPSFFRTSSSGSSTPKSPEQSKYPESSKGHDAAKKSSFRK